ncbi:hypothetical protein LEP1GSC021_0780 [Leptospira noguchii str. 1993005606]|uniref:Uncharacterized protein n=2 Tax=Leptospira noguchii TaxID=28182 RepID=M6YCI2_9LEPT|nr:hypothetical protein LEP1GSC041_4087 [Leptospira noguchii str. 2006001870]EMM98668.1 hypothetical protein LEP1GSC035_0930 [Leptospira noguchii str. 2007001578]EMO27141.1 hypothetical protein LEP1GSC170_2422 [Leptospira interrogans serovar Bataviae str. HAI135]EMO87364.1 hypothetical protein LEP1GSC024_2851 [Leptospira noguchii str. 2001034031]EMS88940.1 hypothetical protein LEP1GSC074_2635 [Leptospira noguchii str. Hook]EPE82696.1 hypothetical protein LEP1GSC021_0780 [Leptospira noguchii st
MFLEMSFVLSPIKIRMTWGKNEIVVSKDAIYPKNVMESMSL